MGRRTLFAMAFALTTLGGSWIGVAAQHGAGDASAAAVFDIVIDATDPDAPRLGADDVRASGNLTIGGGEAIVIDDLLFVPFSVRVENDAGAWVGTARAFGGGDGRDMDLWELVGEGEYEGLSLFVLASDTEGMADWGMILPSSEIPPFPDVPEA